MTLVYIFCLKLVFLICVCVCVNRPSYIKYIITSEILQIGNNTEARRGRIKSYPACFPQSTVRKNMSNTSERSYSTEREENNEEKRKLNSKRSDTPVK